MENQGKSCVIIVLYDLPLTKRNDDCFDRFVTTITYLGLGEKHVRVINTNMLV